MARVRPNQFHHSRRSVLGAGLGLAAAGCMPSPDRPVRMAGSDCGPVAADATGFDAQRLQACFDEFLNGGVNFHGLAIERGGRLVGERYRAGDDHPLDQFLTHHRQFDACALHDVRSISKSVTSLLWGIAAAQARTPSLETPVLDLYPELSDLKTDGRERIRLRHLLSMSTGLEWNEENYGALSNDETALYYRRSPVRLTLKRRVLAPPGTRFNYCGGNTAIIAQLLERSVGMSLSQFAQRSLFAPLGIADWEWAKSYRNSVLSFAGLRLTPRSLLRIGRLVLNQGQWQGRAVVPASWISESVTSHIATNDGLHYGYFWWLGRVSALGAEHDYIAGFGNGGQRLFVVPDLDLVVAITAGNYNIAAQARSNDLFRKIAAAAG